MVEKTGENAGHRAIDYVELGVRDIQAAKAFYAAAFGWIFQDYGPPTPGSAARRAARGWAA
ncbi:VOC family protein [Georgenia yuyongxinii]